MNLDALIRRQAVTGWRDQQLFAAASALNAAAVTTRARFETHLKDAALIQSLWDPAAFARTHVDTAMLDRFGQSLDRWLITAAEELRALDGRFGALAGALAASGPSITMPLAEPGPTPGGSTDQNPVSASPATGIAGKAQEWASWLKSGATDVADTVSRTMQDRSGLDERLRRACGARLADIWLGDKGDPVPVKAQLYSLIDSVANDARGMNL